MENVYTKNKQTMEVKIEQGESEYVERKERGESIENKR